MQLNLLKNFILNNPDLDRLEGMLIDFNVFETLDIVAAEIRHSNVLGWILNPSANHGLGDYFLRRFLKQLLAGINLDSSEFITVFDIEMFSLSNVEIRREWSAIDLLILIDEGEAKG